MERRLILAIAASIFIIMAFQYFVKPQGPAQTMKVTAERPAGLPAREAEMAVYSPTRTSFAEQELEAQTDTLIISFSNVGGAIRKIYLKEHKDSKSGAPLELVNIADPRSYIFAASGQFQPEPVDYKGARIDGTVTYTTTTKDFAVTKRYTLHKSLYIIELQFIVKNISGSPKEFNYRMIGGAGVTEAANVDKRFVEVASKANDKVVNFKRPTKGRVTNIGSIGWTALRNKYFSVILKPFINTVGQFYEEDKSGGLITGIEMGGIVIQPGESTENRFMLYAGPSHIPSLKAAGHGLEETMNYGMFGGISKAMITVMRFFYRVFKNWGLAIILLSISLNIILFPLTLKSFKSMQKMQELHPLMEKLKAQHKDNPQKLNKEIMELYKKYNINPLSGCLPLLLQMPIFFALYQALMKSIELRGAKFLWMGDLSSPDALPIPFSLPFIGNHVNILLLLMIIAMVVQQKISAKAMGAAVTEEQKQQQKVMLIVMPIMFGVIFFGMPSGLVLYWFVNTVLTIVEQGAIFKKA